MLEHRRYGFKHGGMIYMSDRLTRIVEEIVARRANVYRGETLPPHKFVERIDSRSFELLTLDYPVTDLDEQLTEEE